MIFTSLFGIIGFYLWMLITGIIGSNENFELFDIFQRIYIKKKTGKLMVKEDTGFVDVFFNNGIITHTGSEERPERERLGSMLVKDGTLRSEDLESVLSEQSGSKTPLGHLLLQKRLVSRDVLEEIISRQIINQISNLLSQGNKIYGFIPQEVTVDKELNISITPETLQRAVQICSYERDKQNKTISRIEWISSMEEIEALHDKWVELENAVNNCTVFSSFDYVMPWYRHYSGVKKEQYGEPLLGAVWEDNKLIGIAPFTCWKGTLGKIPIRHIDFAGFNAEAGEFLVLDDRPEIIGRVIDSLINRKGFDVISLNSFDVRSKKFEALCKTVINRGLRLEKSEYSYAMVDLRDGYESYRNSMSRNFRRNMKRFSDWINKAGQWRIDSIHYADNREEISPFLERMFSIYNRSWKYKAEGPLAEHHRKFFESIVERFAKRGMLFMSFLSINSEDIAFFLSVFEKGVLYDIFLSYNDLYRKLRPGEFLINEILKKLSDKGIHTFISHGAHEYKRRWATDFAPLTRCFVFSSGLRASIARFMKFGVQPIIKKVTGIKIQC